MNSDLYLSILEILRYLDAEKVSRCIIEGEKIINSKHLITCGVTDFSQSCVKIFAICLRSTSLSASPHVIKGNFLIQNENLNIERFICTCTAGEGGMCKHIAATLIFCNRNSVTSLEKLSCTDVKCIWADQKQNALRPYNPVPVQDTCCGRKPEWCKEKPPVPEEMLKIYRKELLNVAPESALGKHERRANEIPINVLNTEKNENDESAAETSTQSCWKEIFYKTLRNVITPHFLSEKDKTFYEENIIVTPANAISLCENTKGQRNTLWQDERKKRITGSICYSLYTYVKNKNPNWEQKIKSVLHNCKKTSSMQYGLDMEKIAKTTFSSSQNFFLKEIGIIIHPEMPWLGFSPDGLLYKNGKEYLLEIKCPVSGQKKNSSRNCSRPSIYPH